MSNYDTFSGARIYSHCAVAI